MKQYEKYKSSGIEWIGQIPSHWDLKRLKYTTSINDDTLPETTDEDFEISYVDISSIEKGKVASKEIYRFVDAPSRARRKVKHGDIIVSTVRTYLKAIARIKEPDSNMIVSTGFAVVRPKEIYSDYLGNLFLSEYLIGEIISRSVGVSYPAINSSEIGDIKIPIPPLDEQTTIANFLDEKTTQIDKLISNKQKRIELLKGERTAIINEAVSGKGKNWEKKKLKYVVSEKLKYGANEPAEFEVLSDPRYFRITDFGDDGILREDTFKSLPFETAKEYLLKEGDILFARSGATVGKTFQFKNYSGIACFAGYLIKASPDTNQILSDFLYYFTKSGFYENWKDSIFIQATIQNIGADKYSLLEIPVPPLKEQTIIVKHIQTETQCIDNTILKVEKEIELMQEYKTALISEVVTGKIKVI